MIPNSFIFQVNLILLTAIVIIILFLFILKSFKKEDHFFKEELVNAVEKDLNSYLISSTENEGARHASVQQYQIEGIRNEIDSFRSKKVFVDHLISLKKSLFGEYNEVLTDLYMVLGLHDTAIKKLNRFNYPDKLTAIREISEFQYQPGFREVHGFLHSNNKILRQESQIALSKMNEDDPFFFLGNEWRDLTSWHKLRLHHVLKSTNREVSIDLGKWLGHEDAKVRAFIIELCVLFRRVEYMQYIRTMIDDQDQNVKYWVLKAICEMGDDRDIASVVNLLKVSTEKMIRMRCLETLGKIGMKMEIILLIQYLNKEDVEMQFAALSAIHEISGDVELAIQDIFESGIPELYMKMIAHIKDPLN